MKPEMMEQIAATVKDFHLPRYNEIPNFGLYLEQTARYVGECFTPLTGEDITNSMVSNYVKRGLLSSPVKKQYSREQIAYLIFITAAKAVLSMEDLRLMIQIQKRTYKPEVAYDYFCCEFENVLEYIFGHKESLDVVGVENTDEKIMLRNAVVAAAHMVYLRKLFQGLQALEKEQ